MLETDPKREAVIGKAEFVTPTFSEVEVESISGSPTKSELESGNTSNEIRLVMIFLVDWEICYK